MDTAEYNPMECLKTNVNGAENVINACLHNKVKKVIALSTDKAVNQLIFMELQNLLLTNYSLQQTYYHKSRIKFSVVRYGNVVGSRGSVTYLKKF